MSTIQRVTAAVRDVLADCEDEVSESAIVNAVMRALAHPAESSGGDAVDASIVREYLKAETNYRGTFTGHEPTCADEDAFYRARKKLEAVIASGAEHGR